MLRSLNHILVLFIFAGLFRCGKDQKISHPSTNTSCSTFNYSIVSDVETLDPIHILYQQDWQIASFIYEGLMEYRDNSIEIRPLLARTYDVSDNGRQYTFHLRQDIRFQDDPCLAEKRVRLMTAEDVAYTMQRIITHLDETPHVALLKDKIRAVETPDDSTVIISLNDSYATFLRILASPLCYIISKEAVDFYGYNFANHPWEQDRFD